MSEIIILIRWVTPPPKVEIPQLFIFFNFALSSLLLSFFFIYYIYIYISLCPLQHSLMANSSSWFFCEVNVIGPFPLYAILNPIYSQILHVRSIWNSFKIFTVSLSAEEIANGTLKPILSKFSALLLKPFRIPWYTYPFTTIAYDLHLSVRGWHMSSEWEGSGARSSNFFGRTVFHRGYK